MKRHTSAYEGRKRTYTQGYLNAKQNVNAAVYKVIPYTSMYCICTIYVLYIVKARVNIAHRHAVEIIEVD